MRARGLWLGPDGLPRAPWRILLFLAFAFGATVVVQLLMFPLLSRLEGEAAQPLIFTATVVGMLFAHWVMLRRVDGLGWSFAGLDRPAASAPLVAGSTLLGALAIGIPVVLLLAIGWLRLEPWHGGSWMAQALWALVLLLPAAFAEELLLRGYLFSVLRQLWGPVSALVLTSVIFGLLHIANFQQMPEAGSRVQPILMVVLAGIFLGGVLLATGSLYAATAAHLAWNWVMAAVFHAPVSGIELASPGYRLVDAGPEWATGGSWGPEGGLFAGAGMIAAVALLYALKRRRRV